MDRRQFWNWNLQGLGAIALLDLLRRDGLLGQDTGGLHHTPRVKRAIQICLVGGMSHVDSYDYKPELAKRQGQSLQTNEKPDIFFGQVGQLRGSDFEFRQRGESGLWVSEMFPNIAEQADDLTSQPETEARALRFLLNFLRIKSLAQIQFFQTNTSEIHF